MSDHFRLDREAFQQLLANAFAVQESEIDRETLSAFLELERQLQSGELDMAGAMNLIVESARCVANADGVAVGLLKGSQLVYRAGSGCAAADVERGVTASLTPSDEWRTNREILRVENTDEDTRIQAAICRQLSAKSLLVLPIYEESLLAGVLEIRFSQAHVFQEREVRTYRLMAGLIEEAVFRAAERGEAAQLEREEELAALPSADQIPGTTLFSYGAEPGATDAFYQRCVDALARLRKSSILRQSTQKVRRLATTLTTVLVTAADRAKQVDLRKSRAFAFERNHKFADFASYKNRKFAFAAVAIVLGLTCWVAYAAHRPGPSLGAAVPNETANTNVRVNNADNTNININASDQQPLSPQAKPAAANLETVPLAAAVARQPVKPSKVAGRRVRVGTNEVDYLRGDVTVRYFTYKTAPPRPSARKSRITHFGEDVTVRYFAPESGLRPASR